MKIKNVDDIRKAFLKFFEEKKHHIIQSASLIPENDPSILLIGAGMAPLKKYFTGVEKPPLNRMANCQKCIRVGDIEEVGLTSRHMTFFEMLGNFSFGDYFKKESLKFGLEFLVDVLGIDEDRLWVSVYEEDDEAYNIWKNDLNFPEERIVKLGKKDNFWEIGLGPCGPCSEIYYDRGEKYSCDNKNHLPGCECDQFVEVWNHVFTQYNKLEDGSYEPLKNKNIDTGMGLERIAMIAQNVETVFDIDTISKITEYIKSISKNDNEVAVKIISDHIRAVVFMISDGVIVSNESRGYVLRKLIRRASLQAMKLGIKDQMLSKIAKKVIDIHKVGYKILEERKDIVINTIKLEEERFSKTLNKGITLLESYMEDMKKNNLYVLDGKKAFMLYDTYGFPLSLTQEIIAERNYKISEEDFNSEMKKQRDLSKAAVDNSSVSWQGEIEKEISKLNNTIFRGYESIEEKAIVLGIIQEGITSSVNANEKASIILDRTPFYATSGGQEFDKGILSNDNFLAEVISVENNNGIYMHNIEVKKGTINKGDLLTATIDNKRRNNIMRNHTATHLLHAALHNIIGKDASQAGSYVDDKKLRFDFNYFEALSDEKLNEIELLVNQKILESIEVKTTIMNLDDAIESGANALFSEKYEKDVRVLTISDFSKELCGGTHIKNTSSIGLFSISYEKSIASGIRRIEAITGEEAYKRYRKNTDILNELTNEIKLSDNNLVKKIKTNIEDLKIANSKIEELKDKLNRDKIKDIESINIDNVTLYKKIFKNLNNKELQSLAFKIIDNDKNAFVIFYSENENSISIVSASGKNAIEKGFKSGKVISIIAKKLGGGGGGRDNFASAGAKDISSLNKVFNDTEDIIRGIK